MNAERDRADHLLDEICRRGRVIDDLNGEIDLLNAEKAAQEDLIEQLRGALATRNIIPLRLRGAKPTPPDGAA